MLVSLAAAIALGATSMSDIALLAHLAPVLGMAPGGPTVRRALDLAGTAASLDRIARARARARAHVCPRSLRTVKTGAGVRGRQGRDQDGAAGHRGVHDRPRAGHVPGAFQAADAGETDADRDGEPLRELHRRLSPPSQPNPIGFGCGVPSRPAVVSQIVISPVSRRRTRSP